MSVPAGARDDDRRAGHPGPRQVRLPRFVLDEEVGLGTVVKRVTRAFGIAPCGGCERRAAHLDRQIVFTGRRRG